jgi:hypothetical protein
VLDVAMDDILLVAIIDCRYNLLEEFPNDPRNKPMRALRGNSECNAAVLVMAVEKYIPSSSFFDAPFGQDIFEQLTALCQFHHNIQTTRSLNRLPKHHSVAESV